MTEPAPAPSLTSLELDRAIIDASREYIAAQRARPRDVQRINDAKAALDALIAMRDTLNGVSKDDQFLHG